MKDGFSAPGNMPDWVTSFNAEIEEMEARQRAMELAREQAAYETAARAGNIESKQREADSRVNSIATEMISYCYEKLVAACVEPDSKLTVKFCPASQVSWRHFAGREVLLARAWQVKSIEYYDTGAGDDYQRHMTPGLWLEEDGGLRTNWNQLPEIYWDGQYLNPRQLAAAEAYTLPVVTVDALYPRVVWGPTQTLRIDPIELREPWKWHPWPDWRRVPWESSSPTISGLPYKKIGQSHCSQCGPSSPLVRVTPDATNNDPHRDLLARYLTLLLKQNNALV